MSRAQNTSDLTPTRTTSPRPRMYFHSIQSAAHPPSALQPLPGLSPRWSARCRKVQDPDGSDNLAMSPIHSASLHTRDPLARIRHACGSTDGVVLCAACCVLTNKLNHPASTLLLTHPAGSNSSGSAALIHYPFQGSLNVTDWPELSRLRLRAGFLRWWLAPLQLNLQFGRDHSLPGRVLPRRDPHSASCSDHAQQSRGDAADVIACADGHPR